MTESSQVCAVISARNEAASIGNVLSQCHRAGCQHGLVVANGCQDATASVAREQAGRLFRHFAVITVREALGPDVPRAVGAYAALRRFPHAAWFVFVDGDWQGSFGPLLSAGIQEAVASDAHVRFVAAPTPRRDAAPENMHPLRPDEQLWRQCLNRVAPVLRHARPAQLPLFVHRTAFERVSPYWLHHPGRWMAWCALASAHGMQVDVWDEWEPRLAGNPDRDVRHAAQMRQTLMGDAVEGCAMLLRRRPTRLWKGTEYVGYHAQRRIDLLQAWQERLHQGEDDWLPDQFFV